jgi:hypothetical protein
MSIGPEIAGCIVMDVLKGVLEAFGTIFKALPDNPVFYSTLIGIITAVTAQAPL